MLLNWHGMFTLFGKEVRRFLRVTVQTVFTPVLNSLLYLLVFGQVLEEHVQVFPGFSYTAFLIPGLMMMAIIQNAFANSSSSLVQSKIMGSIVFVLLSPISYVQFFCAFLAAAIIRGLLVGFSIYIVAIWFVDLPIMHPAWILAFGLLGSALLGTFGIIAGIWSDKFDQMAAFQNFVIMPLTFLSGVFYSMHSLPPFWQAVSKFNPFFYMIDGFRYGFFGQSDISPWLSFVVVLGFLLGLAWLALKMLKSGYKLRA